MSQRIRVGLAVLAALAAVVVLSHLRILLGDTWVDRDHLDFMHPSRAHLAAALREGRLPEWWDRVGIGTPFAADPNHGVIYPFSWIVAVVPPPFGTDLMLLLHLLFGGVGTALLAHRLGAERWGSFVAGAVLVTSGGVGSIIVVALPPLAFAWMPWIAWAADRVALGPDRQSRLVATTTLAMVVAMQIFVGDPASLIASGWLAFGITVVRAPKRLPAVGLLIGTYLVALILSAVAIAPALAMLRISPRTGGLALPEAGMWSLHPLRLLELVWPDFMGTVRGPAHMATVLANTSLGYAAAPNWMASVYVGIPALLLGGFSVIRKGAGARGLSVLCGIFVLIALGIHTPFYAAYRALVIPEHFIRYPERYLLPACVLICALAGVGFSRTFFGPANRRLLHIGIGCTVVFAIAVTVFFALTPSLALHLAPRVSGGVVLSEGLSAMFDGGIAGVIICALFSAAMGLRFHPRLNRLAVPLALAVMIGSGIGRQWTLFTLADRTAATARSQLLGPAFATVLPGKPPARVYRPPDMSAPLINPNQWAVDLRESGIGNTLSVYGLSTMPGRMPAANRTFSEYWSNNARFGGKALMDRLDVQFAILPRSQTVPGLVLRATGRNGLGLFENPKHWPRAFVSKTLLDVAPYEPCDVHTPRPEHVELACNASEGGFAVVLDGFSPGWSAQLDGHEVPVEIAGGLFRAVAVPPGRHRIAFRYQTPGLRTGATISFFALMGFVTINLRLRRRRAAEVI
jgi:Bacterial membrane protein YfhO